MKKYIVSRTKEGKALLVIETAGTNPMEITSESFDWGRNAETASVHNLAKMILLGEFDSETAQKVETFFVEEVLTRMPVKGFEFDSVTAKFWLSEYEIFWKEYKSWQNEQNNIKVASNS